MVSIDQEVDVTDPAALLAAVSEAPPDAIYHLAALTHVGQSWDEPLRVLEVNVIGDRGAPGRRPASAVPIRGSW